MKEKENSKNNIILKIHAGGTGLNLFLSITIFFWVGFLWALKDNIQAKGLHINYEFIMNFLTAFVGICGFLSAYTFIYWKFNFIELTNDRLISSVLDRSGVWDRSKATILPKFLKTNIALEDIKSLSLNKTGLIRPIAFIIIDKNNKKHQIDTKAFSKAGCLRLIKELKQKGIIVDIEPSVI